MQFNAMYNILCNITNQCHKILCSGCNKVSNLEISYSSTCSTRVYIYQNGIFKTFDLQSVDVNTTYEVSECFLVPRRIPYLVLCVYLHQSNHKYVCGVNPSRPILEKLCTQNARSCNLNGTIS